MGVPTRSIEDRIRALEERVDLLSRVLAARQETPAGEVPAVDPRVIAEPPPSGTPRPEEPSSPLPPPPRAATPAPAPAPAPRAAFSLEGWIGRYGTLALAALTILLGVGAFLSWAITSGRLGPWSRVALGALGALALASVAWRLRRRPTTATFGNILLALALAVVHVDAWGAGPRLQLVTPAVALAVAALASAALAWLALREDEQALYNVGFGGALIGPFVTSPASTPESVWFLLGYGLIVLSAGLLAARTRSWRNPPVVFMLGCAVYTASAEAATGASDAALALSPGVFALLCACLALGAIPRALGARWALGALWVVTIFVAFRVADNHAGSYAVLAALAALTALAAVTRDPKAPLTRFVGSGAIPVATLLLALNLLEDHAVRPWLAAGWAATLVAFAWPLPAKERRVHLATAVLCGGAVLAVVFEGRSFALTISLSAYAAAASLVMARLREPALLFGIVPWLVVATFIGFQDLVDRTDFVYRPFLTRPSLGALGYSSAWILLSYLLFPLLQRRTARELTRADVVRFAAVSATLLWGREELAAAFSPDASVLLLIVYYAVSGMALIYVGRVRQSPGLRRAGLALGIYAALKAVFEASQLEIGFRVGSYLLSGLFLLGVAYWYRKTTDGQAE